MTEPVTHFQQRDLFVVSSIIWPSQQMELVNFKTKPTKFMLWNLSHVCFEDLTG